MIAIGLLAVTVLQTPQPTIPPEVRNAVRRMPLPVSSAPMIATRFVQDTVLAGDKATLVTVYYFPTKLRDTLRHVPLLHQPALVGQVVSRAMHGPVRLPDQFVGRASFDVYVYWQSIYAPSGGRVEASPATLTYRTRAAANFGLDE